MICFCVLSGVFLWLWFVLGCSIWVLVLSFWFCFGVIRPFEFVGGRFLVTFWCTCDFVYLMFGKVGSFGFEIEVVNSVDIAF